MDTLNISKKLLAAGLEQSQAEAIAQIIKSENDNIATKDFVRAEEAALLNKLLISAIVIATICLSLTIFKLFFFPL